MSTEFLSDREQEEALRNWWKDNWSWVASGVAIGFVVLAGIVYWRKHNEQQGVAAAQTYRELTQALAANDKDKVDTLVKRLDGDFGSSPYTDQGHLLLAQSHVNGGRFEIAATELKSVVDKSKDESLVQIAKVRLARVQIQLGHFDEALALLDVNKAGSFAAQVREIRGDAFYAKGDTKAARVEYEAALTALKNADPQRMLNGNEILQLKIQDLDSGAPAAPVAATPPTAGADTTKLEPQKK